MKNKKILLTIALLIMFQGAFAQIKFTYGAALGINYSGLPTTEKYIIQNRNDYVKETNRPVISPILGIWARMNWGKHFYTNIGFQYLRVGNKYHYHRDGNDKLYGGTYTSDDWENQIFDKLSMPLSFGYSIKIKNRTLYAGAGLKLNYFISGAHTEKSLYVKAGDPSNVDRDVTLNPFDATDFSKPASKWNGSLFFEMGMNLNKKLNLEMAYSTGHYNNYRYNDSTIIGGEGWPFLNYGNDDFSLTLKYTIN